MYHFKDYFCLLILTLSSFCSQAQLDATFNYDGAIIAPYGTCDKIFVMKDSRILLIGAIPAKSNYSPTDSTYVSEIALYNENGTPNHSFALNGFYYIHSQYTNNPRISNITEGSNGEIFLSGNTENYWKPNVSSIDFTCFKLHNNGQKDISFGDNGAAITDIARWWHGIWAEHGRDVASDIALQPDGKIILFGATTDDDVDFVRYLPDGRIDSTFGTYGISAVIIPMYGKDPNDVAVMGDGRIVAGFGGDIASANHGIHYMIATRILPNGEPDTTFNHTGIAYYSDGNWLTYCKAMCLQADGKVLLAGYSDSGTVVRFDINGAIDSTFGQNGAVHLSPSSLNAMTLAPDGKILLAGGLDSGWCIYRLLPDGQLDPSFGTGGILFSRLDSLASEVRANCIALQPDGKILVGGASEHRDNQGSIIGGNFLLARYLPDGKTGIDETPREKEVLQIYPSPVKDKLKIRWKGRQPQQVNISVYDVSGRLLWQKGNQIIGNQPFDVDVSAFAAGAYFIKVFNNKGLNESLKFVKE